MDSKEVEHLYKEAKARGEIIELVAELEKENKELKEKLALTENDRDEREVKARDMMKENKNLKLIIEDSEKQMKLYMEDRDNLREENKELKEKLDKLRTDNIYEEGLYE